MREERDAHPTILVIEDEEPLLDAITKKLELNGFTVLTARTVREGLAKVEEVKEGKIDAIWLDHYLKGDEDGLDFLMHLKEQSKKLGEVPIFVVSNTASEEKVISYLQLGAHKYYTKANSRLDQIVNDIQSFLTERK